MDLIWHDGVVVGHLSLTVGLYSRMPSGWDQLLLRIKGYPESWSPKSCQELFLTDQIWLGRVVVDHSSHIFGLYTLVSPEWDWF